MRAFIVRPFGVKDGIDFDAVERDLILPALKEAEVSGGTTGEIMQAGEIHEDMFRLLAIADMVVADVSLNNANVYYELGIRHALRAKVTLLIRQRVPGHDTPFDVKSDRYVEYRGDAPAAAIPALVAAIRATRANPGPDSPLFRKLPGMRDQVIAALIPLPADFQLELRVARQDRDRGRLRLLAVEMDRVSWGMQGKRHIGSALFDLGAFADARPLFKEIVKANPRDVDAWEKLGTICQREGDMAASEHSLKEALELCKDDPRRSAETKALLGRNHKAAWQAEFMKQPPERRGAAAIASRHFDDAINTYYKAFASDLNHSYSGINALALCRIYLALIAREPKAWRRRFFSDFDADHQLRTLRALDDRLQRPVEIAIQVEAGSLAESDAEGATARMHWARISSAWLSRVFSFSTSSTSFCDSSRCPEASSMPASSTRARIPFGCSLSRSITLR